MLFVVWAVRTHPLSFNTDRYEQEFRHERHLEATIRVRYAVATAILLIVCYWYLYWVLFREVEQFRYLIWLGALIGIIALFASTFVRGSAKQAQFITSILLGASGLTWFGLALGTTNGVLAFLLAPCLMTIIYAFYFCNLLFETALITAAFIGGIFLVASWISSGVSFVNVALFFAILGVYLLAANDSLSRERLERVEFIRQKSRIVRQAHRVQAQKDQLQAFSALARLLSHEIKQKLNTVKATIDRLERTGVSERQANFAKAAREATEQAETLLDRAKEGTSIQGLVAGGIKYETNITEFMAEFLANCRRHMSQPPSLRLGAETKNVYVKCDSTLVTRALENLLNNAVELAYDETVVSIGVERLGPTTVRIMVSNDGPLLSPTLKNPFELFATTRGGTESRHMGLGLYLVRLVAEFHDGRANIVNRPDNSGVDAWLTLRTVDDA